MTWLDLHLPVLHVLVPLLVAPLAALLRESTLAWMATTAAALFSLVLAVYSALTIPGHTELVYPLGPWHSPFGIELRLDAFATLLLLIVSAASSAGLLLARDSLISQIGEHRHHLFYCAWLLAHSGLAGIVVAGDAFNIFVFMEISSLATYVLVCGGPDRRALTSVFRYLIMGTIGASFYLIGVGFLYMMTGTLNLEDMAARLAPVSESRPILVAGAFITVGLALKAAVFPLHGWLPDAYRFAPHAATIFIAACSTKVALYVLLRFDFFVLREHLPGRAELFGTFAIGLGVLAMLGGSLMALREQELKRLLAYSSIAQSGYILLGAGLVSASGLTGSLVHFFNHALAKGTLFVAVACMALRCRSFSISALTGVGQRMPLTMAAFVVAALSLVGIPGTAGFVGKWYLLLGALELGSVGLWLCGSMLVSSLIALAYLWRVIERAYVADPGDRRIREAPWPALAVLWILAIGNLYFGLNAELPLSLSRDAAQTLLLQPADATR